MAILGGLLFTEMLRNSATLMQQTSAPVSNNQGATDPFAQTLMNGRLPCVCCCDMPSVMMVIIVLSHDWLCACEYRFTPFVFVRLVFWGATKSLSSLNAHFETFELPAAVAIDCSKWRLHPLLPLLAHCARSVRRG
jgi:hypothetical protein